MQYVFLVGRNQVGIAVEAYLAAVIKAVAVIAQAKVLAYLVEDSKASWRKTRLFSFYLLESFQLGSGGGNLVQFKLTLS